MQDQKGLDLLKLELEQITKERNMLEAEIMKLKQIIEENAKREAKGINLTSQCSIIVSEDLIVEDSNDNDGSSNSNFVNDNINYDITINNIVLNNNKSSGDSNFSDISVTSDTPLRITELTEENEKVPDLPSNLVVINKNTGQGNKNKGLLSDEALDKLIKVANGILEEHQNYNIKIPFVPSLTEAKVVHDGLVHSFPSALLVEGDVIEMIYGDIAPCRIKVISQDLSSDLNNKEQDNKERHHNHN
ncbi:5322_t:CDS:2 [Entrophospora sp. SA101]|nr:5322_t:CDS:2 [Entrophospora sp. SA101]